MNNDHSEAPVRSGISSFARAWEFACHPRLWSSRQRGIFWLLLPLVAIVVSFTVGSQTTTSNIAVDLANDPLYSATLGDKPALTLALSVEYPTVGAQYLKGVNDVTDDTYSTANEYLGYYDANSCYSYNDVRLETPTSGQTNVDYIRFDRVGLAGLTGASGTPSNHRCDITFPNAFSGNFLNWTSSSAIDMLRLALSGGDRYIDTAGSFSATGVPVTPALTILQRAVIPNGDPICMWNSINFPAKQLQKNGGAAGTYWGAVPKAMITAAGSNDIWVANTLNRIFFGTSRSGTCGTTSTYNLSAPTTAEIGPVITPTPPLATDPIALGFVLCGNGSSTCVFSGVKEVLYGAPPLLNVLGIGVGGGWIDFYASNLNGCNTSILGSILAGLNLTGKCYIRDTDGWAPAHSTTFLNTTGFFYSRVQVCQQDLTTGALLDVRDYSFCSKYSNGNYKPGGAIQKYSDQLRLSAFGYLLDQTDSSNGGRYGGVLRAPMKYVGAKTFDSSGQLNTPTTGNANAEWDANNGVFKLNPDANALGISGVVNYLNKFGRTGTPGVYKIYDPVSELYYESLRYLQGLQPSPAAVSNITPAMQNGFPVFTTWADPYGGDRLATGKYACLKSNIVVVGDVNTHDGSTWPSADLAHNIPDRNAWSTVVSNFEKGSVSSYVDGLGVTRQTGNPNTANASPRTDPLISYAYWAHTHDIRGSTWTDKPALQRPGLRVKTFLFDVNESGGSSNADARRYGNPFFTAAKYGGFEADSSVVGGKPYNTYGNPFKQQDGTNNNNVWQDSANPGEANTYYLQSNARGVLSAFDSIFNRASTAARSIAGGATQSTAITQQGSTIYQAAFNTSDWTGDLLAIPISVSASNDVSISATNIWSAADQLKALPSAASSRNIVIGNAGASSLLAAMPFTWTGIASNTALVASLNKTAPAATADGLAQARLNYLRGDASSEGNPFRARSGKLLGDIINSGVVYSGAPSTALSSLTYAAFQQDNLTRTAAAFVGANDGMLHAFNAANGNELFAYIPSWMGPKLSALTVSTYAVNHQSYVDAPPVVAEAEVGSAGTKADWKTVLVSGTGAGGRGVFALDVTDPTAFSAAKVLWEFTQTDDADMGNVVGRPRILKFRTSAAAATTPTYKWFAAVGSGVNNGSGTPALFLLDLAKPVGTAWTSGTNYFKISFPVDSTLAATRATGLQNFSPVVGPSGEVTQLFAGDLHGSLWKLDFRPYGTADWNMSKLSAFNRGTTASPLPYPLFIAKDALGNVQPITGAPAVVRNPLNAGFYVAFGTGRFLETGDRSTVTAQAFYTVFDNQSIVADNSTRASVINGRGRLIAGTLTAATGVGDVPAFVWGRPLTDGDTTQRAGFYFDLTTTGERQISGSTLVGNTLIFGSLIPGAAGDASACGVSGGGGFEYRINIDSGDGGFKISTVGILGQPLVTDLPAISTLSDSTGKRYRTITSIVLGQGSAGIAASPPQQTTVSAGRLSWRQINNYQDLKSTP
jgi:type IV pilus assembly protein PilY1